jgi:flagellar hook protein FlgE
VANDITSISLSALNAYSTMMNNSAHNIANANTDNFKALETKMQDQAGGGVSAQTARSRIEDRVDLSKEVVNMMIAENGIKANIKSIKTAQEKSVIDIIA